MIEQNGSYKIRMNNYTSIYQILSEGGPIDINISKRVHSLDRVYVSFFRPILETRAVINIRQSLHLKEYNFFYSPALHADDATIKYNSSIDI